MSQWCDPSKAGFNSRHRYMLRQLRRLSEGTFGIVTVETDRPRMLNVAVKKFKDGLSDDFLREASALRFLRHRNIVEMDRVLFDHDLAPLLVMPLATCSLYAYLRQSRLEVHAANRVFAQIASGMHYMQDFSLMHLDLKPQNILCFDTHSDALRVKIADFGFASVHFPGRPQSTHVQTVTHRCPEVCLEYKHYTVSADTFSVGLIYFELLTGMSMQKFFGVTDLRHHDSMEQLWECIALSELLVGSRDIPALWRPWATFGNFVRQFPHDYQGRGARPDVLRAISGLQRCVLQHALQLDLSRRFLPDEATCRNLVSGSADAPFVPFTPRRSAFALQNNEVMKNLWAYEDFYDAPEQRERARRGEVDRPPACPTAHRPNLAMRFAVIDRLVFDSATDWQFQPRVVLSGIALFDRVASVRCLRPRSLWRMGCCCVHMACGLYEDASPSLEDWKRRGVCTEDRFEANLREAAYCLKYDLLRPCFLDAFDFGEAQAYLSVDHLAALVGYIEELALTYVLCYNMACVHGLLEEPVRAAVRREWDKGVQHAATAVLVDAVSSVQGGHNSSNPFFGVRTGSNPRGVTSLELRCSLQRRLRRPAAAHVRMVKVRDPADACCTNFHVETQLDGAFASLSVGEVGQVRMAAAPLAGPSDLGRAAPGRASAAPSGAQPAGSACGSQGKNPKRVRLS